MSEGEGAGGCSICFEAGRLLQLTDECSHGACRQCTIDYLCHSISQGRLPLQCHGCKAEVKQETAEALLEEHPDVIEKLHRFSLLRALQRDPMVRFCPQPGCEYAVVCGPQSARCPTIKCEKCLNNFCFRCRGPAHPGQRCEPFLTSENVPDVKPCPGCGLAIYKEPDGTCNHMVCSVCKSEFCWLCLQELKGSQSLTHFLALGGCTMYGKKKWTDAKRRRYRLATPIALPLAVAAGAVALPILSAAMPVILASDDYSANPSMPKRRRIIRASLLGLGFTVLVPVILTGTLVAATVRGAIFAYLQMPVQESRSWFQRMKDRRIERRRLRREVAELSVAAAAAAPGASSTEARSAAAYIVTEEAADAGLESEEIIVENLADLPADAMPAGSKLILVEEVQVVGDAH